MNFLTIKQKRWLVRKEIKIGRSYSFPSLGFIAYSAPDYESGVYMDTNPLTKSLAQESFLVKDKINGFCRGNFSYKPKNIDMYLSEEELSRRGLFEIIFLLIICFIPLSIYNWYKGGVKNIENNMNKI